MICRRMMSHSIALSFGHQHPLRPHPASARACRNANQAGGEAEICTSIIVVAAELHLGAARRGSARLATQLEAVLSVLDIMPFEPPADEVYGVIRTQLEQAGTPIGGNGLLIAAHAKTL